LIRQENVCVIRADDIMLQLWRNWSTVLYQKGWSCANLNSSWGMWLLRIEVYYIYTMQRHVGWVEGECLNVCTIQSWKFVCFWIWRESIFRSILIITGCAILPFCIPTGYVNEMNGSLHGWGPLISEMFARTELSRVSLGCGNSRYGNQTHFPTLRMEKPAGIKKTLKKWRFYNSNLALGFKIFQNKRPLLVCFQHNFS
jgi:hypothetical protein